MMITIHGLPPRTNFLTIKALVKQECNITDLIVDNVVADGPNSKKVRIGLSDDSEGYRVMKNLDGFRMSPTHVLKLVPVGKPLNPAPQQNYDQRPNYQNAPENDYPNQSRQNYPNQSVNDYGNRQGPQGTLERHPGSHGNYVSSGQRRAQHEQPETRTGPLLPPTLRTDNFQRPMEPRLQNQRPDVRIPMNQGSHNPIRSEQWTSNMGSDNQWGSQGHQHDNFNQGTSQPGFGQQQSQNAPDQFGQGRPMDQRFGSDFTPKPQEPAVVPGRRNALRMVEIVDNPSVPVRQQDKPITIMKDNFQGPSNFNVGQQQHGHFDKQPVPSPWQQNQLPKPQGYDDRRPPIDKRPDMPKQMSDYDKRGHFSPPRNRHSPRRMSPSRDGPMNPARNYQETSRRVSPPGRTFPPNDRPSVRGFSPSGRRISPSGRRVSPPGRRISPSGRRVSPSGRRISPMGRRMSPPGRRMSPPGRRMSPGRRDDQRRISPNERRTARHESGRFSPKRGSPTRRLESPGRTHRFSPSRLGAKPSDKFLDDKAAKAVRPAYEPQAQNQSYTGGYRANVHETYGRQGADMSPWQSEKIVFSNVKKDENRRDAGRGNINDKKSPARRSRSPMRRDRSPLKERYRRQTPSPRSSRSPRRSWALEKRSSPEVAREPPPPPVWPGQEPDQPRKSRFDEQKHGPVWEGIGRADDERRPIEEKLRVRADLGDKFSARQQVDRDDFRDGRQMRTGRDLDRLDREFRAEYGRESPRHHDEKVGQFGDIEKDFQDIYKRSVELRKKTEERQKSGDRRREEVQERYSPSSAARDRDDDEWATKGRKRMFLAPAVKAKRDKAVDEICKKIYDKYDLRGEAKVRAGEELKMSLFNVFLEMFGDKDVSFIELVVKYNAKYDEKAEENLVRDVLARLPSQYRTLKRKGKPDISETEAKSSRRSPPAEARRETPRPKLADAIIPEWNSGFPAPNVVVPMVGMGAIDPSQVVVQPGMYMPQVYPQQFAGGSFAQQFSNAMSQQAQFGGDMMTQQANFGADAMSQQAHFSMAQQQQFGGPASQLSPYSAGRAPERPQPAEANDCHNLYLCQDDFEPFTSVQASYLREFIVSQIVRATETAVGWAPDVTIKGLQSVLRYELTTRDDRTKDWILHLDFSEFEYFNVLVYTKEELWYERAAIWLPGHSRSRNLEPLDKLKLQNARLDGVDLTKWKFVKKVVAAKGTRLYVDMPPSSARGLERHDMTLSYELQKVNVFLKAVAVDKDAFDAGLRETSITDPSLLVSAVQTSPMPTLNANSEPDIVKIGIHSQKTITLDQARKIKEVVVYFLFKHLQSGGGGRTDFVKYGFLPPTYLGIVPENAESKRWLTSRNFGKMNRHNIVVFGEEERNIKYFKMSAHVPHEYHASTALIFERLKQSNQGVKGLHFNLWKPLTVRNERKRAVLSIDVDMDSVETLSRLKFRLDYVGEYGIQSVDILSEYSTSKLMEKIRKYKLEQVDSYDVANMDIDSDSNSDVVLREREEEVVFLD